MWTVMVPSFEMDISLLNAEKIKRLHQDRFKFLQMYWSIAVTISCGCFCCVTEACIHCVFFYVYVSAPPCFDFGLPGVLGIAFGGFLIGVLLIGALWFIKIKTGKCTINSEVPVREGTADLVIYLSLNFPSADSPWFRIPNWIRHEHNCSKSFR